MAVQRLLSAVRRLVAPAAIVVLLVCRGWSAELAHQAPPAETTPARLVRTALESEVAGDNQRRDALLRQALSDSPGDPAVNWQLGRVCVAGAWQTPAEVEKAARQDTRLAEYRRRRDAAASTVADQAALARWCRKNRLDDQQRVHWQTALQIQPGNAEAIQALALRPYRGMLLTPAQIKQAKARQQSVVKAADRWRPLVAQWRRAAEGRDPAIPAEAREQIAKIGDAAEMVALEGDLWRQVAAKRQTRLYHDMTLAMMRVLGENPRPVAAESLARYAAFSSFQDVRAAAVAGLKRHPLDHCVPLLLSGLQSPIEATLQCTLGASGDLIAVCTVFQEGALADVSSTLMLWPAYSDLESAPVSVSAAPGTGTVNGQNAQLLMRNDPGLVAAAYAQAKADAASVPRLAADAKAANAVAAAENRRRNAQNAQAQAVQSEAALRDAVDRANRVIAGRNAQIIAALTATTGLELGDQPMDWWQWWWENYNEMYNVRSSSDQGGYDASRKPHYHSDQTVEYRGSAPTRLPATSVGSGAVLAHSCFAPGTKVWTLVGRQPIEKVKVGDHVLAQDVETGELAYKPVLAVTTRPPGPWMKVGLGTESITATPSHPFWVAGQGWRMTKQLASSSRVHTLSGSVPVGSIETLETPPAYAGSAYNLIVADYSDYFVGEQGLLVHDNTPRAPTAAILPGLLRQQSGP
jgi:hypothetical protein